MRWLVAVVLLVAGCAMSHKSDTVKPTPGIASDTTQAGAVNAAVGNVTGIASEKSIKQEMTGWLLLLLVAVLGKSALTDWLSYRLQRIRVNGTYRKKEPT